MQILDQCRHTRAHVFTPSPAPSLSHRLVSVAPAAVYFFRFLVVTFIASNTLAALSRCIACAMPSRVVASATSSLLILINQITNGFNILQGDIPV